MATGWWGLSPCSVPVFHVDSSAGASCLLCFHDPQAAAGPTAVALFSLLGLGGGEAAVRPGKGTAHSLCGCSVLASLLGTLCSLLLLEAAVDMLSQSHTPG